MQAKMEQVGHLFYEALMLRVTYEQLRLGGVQVPFLNNALIESFCIHARNLDEVLRNRGRKDTLKATAFTNNFSSVSRPTDWDDVLMLKVMKQIAHVTEDRVGANKIGPSDRAAMFRVLEIDIQNFVRCLLPKCREAWDAAEKRARGN